MTRSTGFLLCVCLLAACDEWPDAPPAPHPNLGRGVTLVDWTRDGYGEPSAATALGEIAEFANQVVLVPTGYQSDRRATTIHSDPARTPSLPAVRSAIREARSRGLTVVLKPHIDVEDGSWRGQIQPVDPEAWFDSYRGFLLPWVDLAAEEGVGVLVVGTELAGLVEHEELWAALISAVRDRFPADLGYAASWDEAMTVGFWSRLDFVGIDFYFPLATRATAGRADYLVAWQTWLARLDQLRRRVDRPVVITEIGYRSVDGAAARPWEFGTGGTEDQGEQADLYWAAIAATAHLDWVRALWWWNWPTQGGGGPGDLDFTPRRKLAEEVLRAWKR